MGDFASYLQRNCPLPISTANNSPFCVPEDGAAEIAAEDSIPSPASNVHTKRECPARRRGEARQQRVAAKLRRKTVSGRGPSLRARRRRQKAKGKR